MRANVAVWAAAVMMTVSLAACGGDDDSESESASGSESGQPILVGISAAKTGVYEPYDLQSGQLLELRLDEINAAGGANGSKFEVQWIDTQSDKPRAGTAARELISNGAKVVVGTCDFDYSFPAMQAASSENVLGMSLCASSPKAATPQIVGATAGTMGLGSDTEGVAMANWLKENRPEMKKAYIFTDTSIQYSQATANYFKAQWQEAGGEICGEDEFVGSPTLNLSSQVTRLSRAANDCDVIYAGSTIPFGAQLIRSIRDAGIDTAIATNAAVNGTAVTEIGGRVSDVYSMGFACVPTYCSGGSDEVKELNDKFSERNGGGIGSSYALPGYDLGLAISEAAKKAGSTDSQAIAKALFESGLTIDGVIGGDEALKFSAECHRPQPASYSIELFTKGESKQVGDATVKTVPDIGDDNPCAGA